MSSDALYPANEADAALLRALQQVAGLDVGLGLARTAHQHRLYATLLRKFVLGQGDALQRLYQAFERANLGEAERTAHTLAALAGNIGATNLQLSAGRLENALRHSMDALDIKTLLNDTAQLLTVLVSALRRTPGLLRSETSRRPLTATEREHGARLLDEIVRYMAADDVTALELWEANAELLHSLFPQAQELDAAINGFDFESALRLLTARALQ